MKWLSYLFLLMIKTVSGQTLTDSSFCLKDDKSLNCFHDSLIQISFEKNRIQNIILLNGRLSYYERDKLFRFHFETHKEDHRLVSTEFFMSVHRKNGVKLLYKGAVYSLSDRGRSSDSSLNHLLESIHFSFEPSKFYTGHDIYFVLDSILFKMIFYQGKLDELKSDNPVFTLSVSFTDIFKKKRDSAEDFMYFNKAKNKGYSFIKYSAFIFKRNGASIAYFDKGYFEYDGYNWKGQARLLYYFNNKGRLVSDEAVPLFCECERAFGINR